jgi:hypothetical protein
VGNPETCPTCGSAVRFSTEIACASGAWTDPWHYATPPPPGAAPDAASGPKAPPRMPAPADADPLMPKDVPGAAAFRDAFKKAVPPRGADHVSWVNGYCAGWIACEKAPAPDAGAAEDHLSEAKRDHGAEGSHRAFVEAARALLDSWKWQPGYGDNYLIPRHRIDALRDALRGTKGA